MSREKSDSGGGLNIQTLLISAVGAVAAATIVPLFWAKGTIIATAMTPVVVALVSEALRRPAEPGSGRRRDPPSRVAGLARPRAGALPAA